MFNSHTKVWIKFILQNLDTFLWQKKCIFIKISLKFVPTAPTDNMSSLVKVIVWRRTSNKPELMMTPFTESYIFHRAPMRPHVNHIVQCNTNIVVVRFTRNCTNCVNLIKNVTIDYFRLWKYPLCILFRGFRRYYRLKTYQTCLSPRCSFLSLSQQSILSSMYNPCWPKSRLWIYVHINISTGQQRTTVKIKGIIAEVSGNEVPMYEGVHVRTVTNLWTWAPFTNMD